MHHLLRCTTLIFYKGRIDAADPAHLPLNAAPHTIGKAGVIVQSTN